MNKIKNHFISRYGDNGILVEMDWAQLEVCVFALLCQDPQLIKDLNENKDIHRELGAIVFNCLSNEVTKEQRQKIKPGTFLCIYGGGANKFSREHNVTLEFAKKFIEAFYDRYPIAKQWQQNLIRQVEASKYLINEYTDKKQQKHEGYLRSVTGRKYYFKTNDTPSFLEEKGILTGFNPPEVKNYPVQGLATGDIHLIALGLLWRASLEHRDKYLLINTVHDSVLLDVRKEYLDFTCKYVKSVLESVQEILKNKFHIRMNVKLKVECKIGKSWGEMVEYEI